MKTETFLFVYGTLRRGQPHGDRMDEAEYLGPARTGPGFRLVELEYPCLVRESRLDWRGLPVYGELYRIKSEEHLEKLDLFEEAPNEYKRVEIPVYRLDSSSEPVKAHVYLYAHQERALSAGRTAYNNPAFQGLLGERQRLYRTHQIRALR